MNNKNSRVSISFEWHSLFRDIVRNFWLVILVGAVAYMGLYLAQRSIYKPVYTSSATLVVHSRVGTSGQYTSLSVSAEMAEIFTQVFCQPSMKRHAAENLGLSTFDGSVSAGVISSTNLMVLSVTADEPEKAYRLLSSILEVYPDISESVFSNSVIEIISHPGVPSSPSNTIPASRRTQIILLAMAVEGLGIVLLSLLRNTVKTEQQFVQKIDAKLLGTVTHEKAHLSLSERLRRIKRATLCGSVYASLRFTEDFQKIAHKLEYERSSRNNKVFSVTSVAENEGKSTVAVNIALSLVSRGHSVALLDLDTRKPSVYKILDHRGKLQAELSDILSGKVPIEGYPLLRYRKSKLFLAMNRTPRSDSPEWLVGPMLPSVLERLKSKFDFIIIDTPPTSVSADAVHIASVADRALLVVRTDKVAAEDINDTVMTLENAGAGLKGCILNDVHKAFTLFGQIGSDEYGYYKYTRRGKYSYASSYSAFRDDSFILSSAPKTTEAGGERTDG